MSELKSLRQRSSIHIGLLYITIVDLIPFFPGYDGPGGAGPRRPQVISPVTNSQVVFQIAMNLSNAVHQNHQG